MDKTYTVREICELGLLKNYRDEPYKHAASIARIVRTQMQYTKRPAPGGYIYLVPLSEIERYNNRHV